MDPAYVATHVEEDRRHWWFRGRLAVLLAILRRVLPPGHARLLELGCGTGNVLAALAEFGEAVGMETRSEEHTSELQSLTNLVCRLLLEKKKITRVFIFKKTKSS